MNNELNDNLQIEKYINHLGTQVNIEDWQIRQAHDAIRLYFSHLNSANNKDGDVQTMYAHNDIKSLIDKTRQAF